MSFPDITALLPHRGAMRLLRRVIAHDEGETTCAVDPADSVLFRRRDGSVPAFVAIEYMAQCIAAHGGLVAQQRGEDVRPGLLLGARRLALHAASFAPDVELRVAARHVRGDASGMFQFDCRLWANESDPLAEGRLNVYIPDDPGQLLGSTPP
jgi:predicted hotdog family 3-hydroxylacyl-ACP dehydratase